MKPMTAIIIVALIGVMVAGIVFRFIGGEGGNPAPPEPTDVLQKDTLEITVLAALALEPWLASAAEVYNAEDRFVGDRPVKVVIEPMDGLSARDKWASGAFTSFPTAWVAESREWVDQANIAALDRTGRTYSSPAAGIEPSLSHFRPWSGVYGPRPSSPWRAIREMTSCPGMRSTTLRSRATGRTWKGRKTGVSSSWW